MSSINIDLNDPETLLFDEKPHCFVLLNAGKVVFTIRGLRHFTPRFKRVGIEICNLDTEPQFRAAIKAWDQLEAVLLLDSIRAKAQATHQPNEHQVLLATIMGDIDAAEAAMDRLDHQRRAGLTVVSAKRHNG